MGLIMHNLHALIEPLSRTFRVWPGIKVVDTWSKKSLLCCGTLSVSVNGLKKTAGCVLGEKNNGKERWDFFLKYIIQIIPNSAEDVTVWNTGEWGNHIKLFSSIWIWKFFRFEFDWMSQVFVLIEEKKLFKFFQISGIIIMLQLPL